MAVSIEYLEKAVKLLGGQTALAKACGHGLKQQHIWNWLNRDQKVPAQYIVLIEQATGGLVTREQLRPDLYLSESDEGQAQTEAALIDHEC